MITVLYGECVSALDTADIAKVRISALANQGCELQTDAPATMFDSDFSLWIGAMGPFAATAVQKNDQTIAIQFKEPLDGRILHHFNGHAG